MSESTPTVADRFLRTFGPEAFSHGRDKALAALEWLAVTDPDGIGQLVDGNLKYNFTDHSSLILNRTTRRFERPQ